MKSLLHTCWSRYRTLQAVPQVHLRKLQKCLANKWRGFESETAEYSANHDESECDSEQLQAKALG
jgi:hypothetical protein